MKSSQKSSQSLLSSVVVLSALGGLGGCPADEGPKDPPAEVIEATVALTPGAGAIGTTLPLDVTANCDVTALELVDADPARVEVAGLGSRSLQIRANVTSSDMRERVLAIKDDEIVAKLKVRVSCADREPIVVDGGTTTFFPVTAARSVANASDALNSTTVVFAKPSQSSAGNTEVLFGSGGVLYLSREDGTSSTRDLDVRAANDVRDADPAYGVGDWFVRTERSLFLDDELATLTTDFPEGGFALQMATFGSKLFEVTPLTGGFGNHGILVYETDGTVNDHTVEGVMLARSGTPWGAGQHHLFLLGQGEDVVLLQTDPLADDGVGLLDTIALPAKYADDNVGTLKFELAAPKDFGPIYIAITRGSDTTIYRSVSGSFGTEPFGPLEEMGTLLADSLSMVVQDTGRLWISHNADITILGDDGLETLVSVPGHVVIQNDGSGGAFLLKEADRVVAYSAAGERLFKIPAVLTQLATAPAFDLATAYTEDSATIQLFENSGLEELELDVIE